MHTEAMNLEMKRQARKQLARAACMRSGLTRTCRVLLYFFQGKIFSNREYNESLMYARYRKHSCGVLGMVYLGITAAIRHLLLLLINISYRAICMYT
jgi:hypothetical protein